MLSCLLAQMRVIFHAGVFLFSDVFHVVFLHLWFFPFIHGFFPFIWDFLFMRLFSFVWGFLFMRFFSFIWGFLFMWLFSFMCLFSRVLSNTVYEPYRQIQKRNEG